MWTDVDSKEPKRQRASVKLPADAVETLRRVTKPQGIGQGFLLAHLVEEYAAGRVASPGGARPAGRGWRDEIFEAPAKGAHVTHSGGDGVTFSLAWEDGGKWVADRLSAEGLTGGGVAQVDSEGRLRVFYACGSVTLHENNKKGADDDR